MGLTAKKYIIGVLGLIFLASLVLVQWKEVQRREHETSGRSTTNVSVPHRSQACVECHSQSSPGITDHWKFSTHAQKGIGCVECHEADTEDVDSFLHYGETIATIVTPRDCSKCHKTEYEEFTNSHHAMAGNILASLDNRLAETIEGNREMYNPHSPTPGRAIEMVNGMASVNSGCKQCHGSLVALEGTDGSLITMNELQPDENGRPTNKEAVALIKRDVNLRPTYHSSTWPNSGIGRMNLDGSRGSCSACHSRHDFSPRRARRPENCGKCHLGPDHPQKEIYEESKHGVAFRDLHDKMNLDAKHWVLGEDYTQAPTCATCHMSGHSRNGGKVTHDPSIRLSWTNRPPVSLVMDTDKDGKVIKETDPVKRQALIDEAKALGKPASWQEKRQNMQQVCLHCHTQNYVGAFYQQYDDFVVNFNEKFAKPGKAIMKSLRDAKLITKPQFDEEIEWTWFYLWHHEGRRARHGASMMAPDYAHWHGMYEVAERFYMEFIPQAREIAEHAKEEGHADECEAVEKVINGILARPEHQWFEEEKKKRKDAAANLDENMKKALADMPASPKADTPEARAALEAASEEADLSTEKAVPAVPSEEVGKLDPVGTSNN